MRFEVKKAENCFADAENYEYRVAAEGAETARALEELGALLRYNDAARRPTFLALLQDGTRIRGLLHKDVIKAGFPPQNADEARQRFETWLSAL
jgi:hypothetical protein